MHYSVISLRYVRGVAHTKSTAPSLLRAMFATDTRSAQHWPLPDHAQHRPTTTISRPNPSDPRQTNGGADEGGDEMSKHRAFALIVGQSADGFTTNATLRRGVSSCTITGTRTLSLGKMLTMEKSIVSLGLAPAIGATQLVPNSGGVDATGDGFVISATSRSVPTRVRERSDTLDNVGGSSSRASGRKRSLENREDEVSDGDGGDGDGGRRRRRLSSTGAMGANPVEVTDFPLTLAPSNERSWMSNIRNPFGSTHTPPTELPRGLQAFDGDPHRSAQLARATALVATLQNIFDDDNVTRIVDTAAVSIHDTATVEPSSNGCKGAQPALIQALSQHGGVTVIAKISAGMVLPLRSLSRLCVRHNITDGMVTLDGSQMGDFGNASSIPRRVASSRGLPTLTVVLRVPGDPPIGPTGAATSRA